MKRSLFGLCAALALAAAPWAGASADTIKVGIVASFSGPYSIYGKQFKEALELFQKDHGTKAGSHEVEFVYKDSTGPNPDVSKQVTQELLIKDGVKYLGGYVFTPNALAVAPLITQSQTPTVIFNAATSIITKKSPYFIRTSFTLPQNSGPMADWAIAHGIKTVTTAVTDYGPGVDAEKTFIKEFEKKGGKIVDKIRMPIKTTDFAPFVQRIKSDKPNALFVFIPAGPTAFSFTKAYSDYGLKAAGIEFLGTGDVDDETTLQALGDAAIGIKTAYPYSAAHKSALNDKLKSDMAKLHPDSIVNFATVDAYDGAYVLYKMIAAAGTNSAAALKVAEGLKWESARGPVSIDPKNHSITENIYIREVAKDANGKLENKEIATFKNVPDLGQASK